MKPLPFPVEKSIYISVVSVIAAILIRFELDEPIRSFAAYILVGAWAILPPIWFIYDWSNFDTTKGNLEHFKYSQELARNVWVALVVVLAAITGINWGGA